MKWVETTDKNNPLSCRGVIICRGLNTQQMETYYSVRKGISGLWEAMFWLADMEACS